MKTLPKSTLVFVLTLLVSQAIGQSLKIVPPTPNAAKITEYYAQQPNMYTGTANVSIPLHTIDFDGWNLPFTLSYNATGVRTNEQASEVGLGWALNATGVISRTVRGIDDLFQTTVFNQPVQRFKGYFYSRKKIQTDLGYDQFTDPVVPSDSYFNYLFTERPDTEPDIFHYNFFGYSGSFVLRQLVDSPDGTNLIIKLTEDATRIDFNLADESFTVVTPEGFVGEFKVKERSSSMGGRRETIYKDQCCGIQFIDDWELVHEAGTLRSISSWYLSKITSPANRTLNFNYDLQPDGSSLYISNDRVLAEDGGIAQSPQCLQTIHEHVYLKEIVSADLGLRVDFVMEKREDLRMNKIYQPGGIDQDFFPFGLRLKRYREIRIKGTHPQSTLNKSIIFWQTYFNQQYHRDDDIETENEVQWMRSRLDRLQIDDQEYRFTYHKGLNGLPNKWTRAIDHFGFYNGQDDNTSILYPATPYNDGDCDLRTSINQSYQQQLNRRPDLMFGIAGALSKVRYPTKGYSLFEYETHSYKPDQSLPLHEEGMAANAGGARIKSIKEYNFDNTLLRERRYVYTKNGNITGETTGLLMTPLMNLGKAPLYQAGYSAESTRYQCNFIIQPNTSIPGNNTAEGKIIGYSIVHEWIYGEGGNYKNTYYFENTPNIPLNLPFAVEGFPNLNGTAKEIRNYGVEGKIQQITKNSLYDNPQGSVTAIAQRVVQAILPFQVQFYDIKRTFTQPRRSEVIVARNNSGIVEDSNGNIVTEGQVVKTLQNRSFDSKFLLFTEETTNSDGSTHSVQYRRPQYYDVTPAPSIVALKNKNIASPVIEQLQLQNGVIISSVANQFTFEDGKGMLLLSTYQYGKELGAPVHASSGYTFPAPYQQISVYPLAEYTSKGKPGEFKEVDGIVNSFIWDYDGLLPVVHGQGVSQDNLEIAHNAALASGDYESALRQHPAVAGARITTFKHNPHVGISQSADAMGKKTSYVYDEFSRLQKVIDNDGNTLTQYDYNFKQLPTRRILRLGGDVNFGPLVPDLFLEKPEWYTHCGKERISKTFTVFNDSQDDDLIIQQLQLPNFCYTTFTSALIPPESSIEITINFNSLVAFGAYTGDILIFSNKTEGPDRISVSANYAARQCDLDLNTSVIDFGEVTGSFGGQRFIEVTNNGNAPVKLWDVLMDWDGTTVNYDGDDFTDPEFSANRTQRCINPGETASIGVQFLPPVVGQYSTKVSLLFDDCPDQKDAVLLQGTRIQMISTLTTDVTSQNFGTFWQETFATRKVKVRNTGNLGFHVQQLFIEDPAEQQHFAISTSIPMPMLLNPGDEQEVTIVFAPTTFGVIDANLVIRHDAMQPVGDKFIALTGNRYRNAIISLNPSELVFDNTGETRSITISNNGNAAFNLDNYSPSNASMEDWSVTSFTAGTVNPGQSRTMSVFRKPGTTTDQLITLQTSGVSSGPTTFWVKANVRELAMPSLVSMPAFTANSVTTTVNVSSAGNQPIAVTNITSNNSRYTISPTSFTLPTNGSSITLTVTYTPTDFLTQTARFTFASNATSGPTYFDVTGIWTQLKTISISPSQVSIIGHGSSDVTVTNTGNTNLTITGVKFGYTPTGTFSTTSTSWTASFPTSTVILSRGQSTTLRAQSISSAPEGQYIQVQYDKTGAYNSNDLLQAGAVTRVISLSKATINFPGFTEPSISDNVVMTNTGNSSLTITNITCTNSMFSVSPASFTLAPGAQQNLTVTFAPAAFNFNAQSGTFSFQGNQTSGGGLTANGTRTSLRVISLSPSPFTFAGASFTWENVTISNSGNDYLQVTGVSNPNTADWTAEIVGGTATIAPGSTGTLRIMKKNGNPSATTLTVISNKNSGTETVAVSALKRLISISPSTYTFPTFYSSTTSANFTVSNSGDQTLTVSSVSTTNSRFTVSPSSFTVPAGGSQTVTVTYTATDFTSQSSTITFNSDATAGSSGLSVTAQRTSLVQWSMSPTSMVVRPWATGTITIQNTGNQPVTLSASFLGLNTYYTVSYSGSPANPNPPVVLQPGQLWYITVTFKATGGNSSNSRITITQTSPTPTTSNQTAITTATM